MIIRRAAISHSKHRNEFGLVGIEVDDKERKIKVKLVRQWPRTQLSGVPVAIANMFMQVKWDVTYIDQLTGEHFIQELSNLGIPVSVITTERDMKNIDELVRIRVMDKVEMVQWMIGIKQAHQIEFPPKPSKQMSELESQMAIFTEHKTEAGSIDYFAPGDAFDNLTKALMIASFSVRNMLSRNDGIGMYGIIGESQDNVRDAEAEFLETFPLSGRV